MKKIIYTIILLSLFIATPKAFNIDVNKINIGIKSDKLIDNLNKSYKIDTNGFSKEEIVVDKEADELVKTLTEISLQDSSIEDKRKLFTKYQMISKTSGGETLATALLIDVYFDEFNKQKIEAGYIKEIRNVTFNQDDVLSFAYLGDSKIDGEEENVILIFWLKKDNGEYKLFYPWMMLGKDCETYFNKVEANEDNGEVISGTYKELSLNNSAHQISNEELMTVYQNNYTSVVQITGMNDTGSNMYGSGFFLREGVIVTTWSLFSQFLANSNYIYVNDAKGNTYKVLGVVAAQVDYDVVVLKIDKNEGKGVSLGDSTKLKIDDHLFLINSKNNAGFSISYGTFATENKGRMRNMFLLHSSDVGAALFNKDGQVVGITSGEKINSELSYANSTNYLVRLQNILRSEIYDKISYTMLETFKQAYYTELKSEKVYNYVDSNIWNKVKDIGKIEENIKLDLLKANYVDKIVSLRYKCDTKNMIDTMFLVASYTEELTMEGYKLTYEDEYKKIYQNNKYKIIIKSNLQYLIILIMEK